MTNFLTQDTPRVGVNLQNYILLEEIGGGGHGIVYKGYHNHQPNETLAIKIIEDTGSLDTLLVEPELLSRLNHPNIISLKDYFLHQGKLILVTEYIDGIDLNTYLEQQGKLTPEEVKIFLTQMASALVEAHANNIVHRDLKLGNILVTGKDENRRFVLVDFGISRMAEGIQMVKRVAGTYYYMAPEQLRGRPCEQSDLWGLGVCAYALLTGVKPFEANTQEDLSQKILLSNPQAPSEILEHIDPQLEEIIFHLLEKELINRTASASELLEEIQNLPTLTNTPSIVTPKLADKAQSFIPTWEKQDMAQLKKSWIFFWIFVFLAVFPSGIVGDAISLTGAIVFYLGQEKRNLFRTVSGIFIMLLGRLVSLIFLTITDNIINGISLWIYFLELPFTLIAVHYLTKIRRLQETLLFHRTLRQASRDSENIISLLKRFIDINWENLNLRQKYIELLLLERKVEEAIVEAKLTLELDPYNFGINLLLANGYFEAGLYEQCSQVCNSYLAVSGYSFEFSELKYKCERLMGA